MISVIDAITTRKSVRSFTKKKVGLKTIKKIISLAAQSPSGTNTQPWNVHVLTGNNLKEFCRACKNEFLKNSEKLSLERLNYMKKYREPYISRRRKVGWDLYNILKIKKGDYTKTKNFHTKKKGMITAKSPGGIGPPQQTYTASPSGYIYTGILHWDPGASVTWERFCCVCLVLTIL